MILRAFIVDDEPPARTRLRQLLIEAGDVRVVGEAGDAIEARPAIVRLQPDVVFLDIEMPQVSGTAFAASLPDPRPFVVFATAYDHYALEAFEVDATDFLVKPVSRGRLAGTLTRVRERLLRRSDLERELAAATVAQTLLLPRALPAIPGFDCAARTVAARGVGGDFFLAQPLTAERSVLALGDVSGKGMSAGLVASSLQARIETVARHRPGSAADVVSEVNRTLCATLDAQRFATLVYVEIEADTGRLLIVNAGHPAVLVLSPGGAPLRVSSGGPALGLLPDARFEMEPHTLAPGALAFIFSDGVTEAFDVGDEEFGEDRLVATLAAVAGASAADACEAVVAAVQAHARGTRPSDDLTVLAIKRDPGGLR